jgi:hypothetical protein
VPCLRDAASVRLNYSIYLSVANDRFYCWTPPGDGYSPVFLFTRANQRRSVTLLPLRLPIIYMYQSEGERGAINIISVPLWRTSQTKCKHRDTNVCNVDQKRCQPSQCACGRPRLVEQTGPLIITIKHRPKLRSIY